MMGMERIAMALPWHSSALGGWVGFSLATLGAIRDLKSVGSLNATRDGGRNGAQFFGFLFDVGHQGLG